MCQHQERGPDHTQKFFFKKYQTKIKTTTWMTQGKNGATDGTHLTMFVQVVITAIT